MKQNPTSELISFFIHREALKFELRCNRKSVKNLLDFAMGYKQLKNPQRYVCNNSEENEARMMNTIKNLHEQNRRLRQQLREDLDNVIAE